MPLFLMVQKLMQMLKFICHRQALDASHSRDVCNSRMTTPWNATTLSILQARVFHHVYVGIFWRNKYIKAIRSRGLPIWAFYSHLCRFHQNLPNRCCVFWVSFYSLAIKSTSTFLRFWEQTRERIVLQYCRSHRFLCLYWTQMKFENYQ